MGENCQLSRQTHNGDNRNRTRGGTGEIKINGFKLDGSQIKLVQLRAPPVVVFTSIDDQWPFDFRSFSLLHALLLPTSGAPSWFMQPYFDPLGN